jgi:hypothetical protein
MLMGLLFASAVSCVFLPHGVQGPRELLAPLLAPVGRVLSVLSLNVRRNASAGAPLDDETARQFLQDNEALQRQLTQYLVSQNERQAASSHQFWLQEKTRLEQADAWTRAMPREFPCMILPARVVAGPATPYQRTRTLQMKRSSVSVGDFVTTRAILINRSTALPGTPAVLSSSAVVGRIIESGAWTAHLQLVTDQNFQLKAFVQRVFDPKHPRQIEDIGPGTGQPRSRPLREDDGPVPVNLTGCGDGLISAAVSEGHAIAPGDLVLTMGEDGRLPMAVVVGRVRSCEPVGNSSRHVRLRVEPEAKLDTLENVYIVLPQAREAAS